MLRWLLIAAALVAVWWIFFRKEDPQERMKAARQRFGVLPGGAPLPTRFSASGPETLPTPAGRGDLS